MSNLLASLGTSANALGVLQKALDVIQNNVANASTPGYASQSLNIVSQPLDIVAGSAGGIAANGLSSSRDAYADSAVQSGLQLLGFYSAQSQSTSGIQSFFDVSGTSGVAGALNGMLSSFSNWSVSPADPAARQQVISAASAVADSVNSLSTSISRTSSQLDQQISSTVDQINQLGAQIRSYNATRLRATEPDPGLDAQMHTALESLSQLVNIHTLTHANGTVTVLAAGGTPLVIGDQTNALSATQFLASQPPPSNPGAPPSAHLLDASGNDITSAVSGGELGGLLDTRNRVIPSFTGDGSNAGSLNIFARKLADTVNGILTSGMTSVDAGAAPGKNLFVYDATDATRAAATLATNPDITPDQLAPVDAGGRANGNANLLASLGQNNAAAGQIDGKSLVAYFAGIAAQAGSEDNTAKANQQQQQQVVTQARSARDQISGVSLDKQASLVLELQRGYQAVSRVITVVNSLVDSVLNLIPQA